jgi:hypothetical protein
MARDNVKIIDLAGDYSPHFVFDTTANLWTPGVPANGLQWLMQDLDILLHRNNDGAGAVTVTIVARAGFKGTSPSYQKAIPNGVNACWPIGPLQARHWRQSTGLTLVDVSATGAEFCVLRGGI